MSVQLWSDRVLAIFGAERERFAVCCVRCRKSFATAQALRAHASCCRISRRPHAV